MANGFIDKARITVRAGNGGNGAVAFHREKYVAAGGPDGGDGGDGGSIIVQVDDNMSTLMDFRYKRKYVAAPGVDGQGGRKSGKDGQSLTIRVPRGTLIRDAETGEIIKDMSDSEPFVLCKGGRGGWGNQHFATPTRHPSLLWMGYIDLQLYILRLPQPPPGSAALRPSQDFSFSSFIVPPYYDACGLFRAVHSHNPPQYSHTATSFLQRNTSF